jgi:hypothetical protein
MAATAFTTPMGHFQWKVLSFDLTNAPAVCSLALTTILRPVIGHGVQVLLDDICIHAKTEAEHLVILDSVLTLLHKAKLYLNLQKCDFCQRQLTFLGHITYEHGIAAYPSKLASVQTWAYHKFEGFTILGPG